MIQPYLDRHADDAAALFDAIHAAQPTFSTTTVESWRAFTKRSFNRGAKDFLVAHEGDQLVALTTSTLLDDGEVPYRHFRIMVHPSHRRQGLGRRMLQAVLGQESRPGTRLQCNSNLSWPEGRAFLESEGFKEERRELEMCFRGELPAAEMPPFRAFQAGQDEALWVALHEDGYAGGPSYSPLTAEDVAVNAEEAGFGMWLAERDGEAVGMCHVARAGGGANGMIDSIVVRSDQRGTGLGRALLHKGMQELRGQGCETIELFVLSDNAAAVGLYTSYGFEISDATCTFRRGLS